MKRINWVIVLVTVLASAALFAVFAVGALSPSTSAPERITISPGEQCRKEFGKLKCRWNGPCVKEGNDVLVA